MRCSRCELNRFAVMAFDRRRRNMFGYQGDRPAEGQALDQAVYKHQQCAALKSRRDHGHDHRVCSCIAATEQTRPAAGPLGPARAPRGRSWETRAAFLQLAPGMLVFA